MAAGYSEQFDRMVRWCIVVRVRFTMALLWNRKLLVHRGPEPSGPNFRTMALLSRKPRNRYGAHFSREPYKLLNTEADPVYDRDR